MLKKHQKVCDDLFTFASDDIIPGKQTTKQPVECWQLIAQQQVGITINVEIGF